MARIHDFLNPIQIVHELVHGARISRLVQGNLGFADMLQRSLNMSRECYAVAFHF